MQTGDSLVPPGVACSPCKFGCTILAKNDEKELPLLAKLPAFAGYPLALFQRSHFVVVLSSNSEQTVSPRI